MVRRGFSLIEVLAVVAILVVVTAISLPAVEGRLAKSRFDAGVARVDASLAWVRAESQRRGEPLKVTVRDVRGGVGLFVEVVRAPAEGRDEKPVTPDVVAIFENGLKLSNRAPDAGKDGATEPEHPAPSSAGAPEGEGLLVAVFLPDGSAMASGPVYVFDAERTAAVTVNQWIGGVKVSEVVRQVEGPAEPASTGSEEP